MHRSVGESMRHCRPPCSKRGGFRSDSLGRPQPDPVSRRMSMFKVLQVKLNERVVIFKAGVPFRAYGPGRHLIWGIHITEQRFSVTELLLRALPEVRAKLPSAWYREVTISALERAVLSVDGVP